MLATSTMSTTFSFDVYDAQMLDFSGDIQVDDPMSSAAAAESYFHEAPMDDEGHLIHDAPSEFTSHDNVEVEMEPYSGENAEYEMEDEFSEYHHPAPELLDVEVYDASRAHSPTPFFPPGAQDAGSHLVNDISLFQHSVHTDSLPPPDVSHPDAIVALDGISVHAIGSVDPSSPSFDQVALSEETASHTALPDEGVNMTVGHSENGAEGAELAIGHTESVSYSVSEVISEIGPGASFRRSDIRDSLTTTTVVEQPEHDGQNDAPAHDVPQDHEELHVAEPVVTSEDGPHDDFAAPSNDVQSAHTALEDGGVAEESTSDPHEISEGVYIDPPPAVLLSLPPSTESEYCLFNQPYPEPSFSSPREGFVSSSRKELTLFLHHRPTLYYEPLSRVFEAFRQEDIVSLIPDATEGELVIDAYDLQLVIFEDNVFAREVTLHDLNVLHDGSDITGPLRIQLRSVLPRFIVRYHLLQDQIARLNIADGGVDQSEGAENLLEYSHGEEYVAENELHEPAEEAAHADEEPTQESEPQQNLDEHHEPEYPPDQSESLADQPEVDPQDRHGAHYEAAEVSSDQVEPPIDEPEVQEVARDPSRALSEDPEGEFHEVQGDEAHVPEGEGGDEQTNTAEEDTEPALDADAIHTTADTDAPVTVDDGQGEYDGEYSEYQDHVEPEDDDERYGDALPAELGSEQDEEESQNVIFTEPDELEISAKHGQPVEAFSGSYFDREASSTDSVHQTSVAESSRDFKENDGSSSSSHNDGADDVPEVNENHQQSTQANHDFDPPDNLTEHAGSTQEYAIDESDSNFLAMLEHEAETNSVPDKPATAGGIFDEQADSFEDFNDEWDWDADAEGEPDDEWVDPEVDSNESSITLSSKTSSKRAHDDVEPDEEAPIPTERISPPDSKRSRVQ